MTDIHEIEVATADESDGVLSDSEQDYPNRNTTPQSLEEFGRWQAHIGLQKFGEGLNTAAKTTANLRITLFSHHCSTFPLLV